MGKVKRYFKKLFGIYSLEDIIEECLKETGFRGLNRLLLYIKFHTPEPISDEIERFRLSLFDQLPRFRSQINQKGFF